MSIVSVEFLVFLLIVLIVYYMVPKRFQQAVLLISSYGFYLLAGITPLIFVFLTTVVTYTSARIIGRIRQNKESKAIAKKKSKVVLVFTILIVFGTLFSFKYLGFIQENIQGLLGLFKYDVSKPLENIMLPLGISFYMFQAIGYCIDVYRKKIVAEDKFFRFALFISFFPQAIQGPISRYDNLGGELQKEHHLSYDNLTKGAQLIVWGYFKKMVIADRLAIPVDTVFDNYQNFDGTQILIAIVLYALQIYTDFSGGIDIIRGAAQCMGITLIENFRRPYFGNTVAEYWRRWHMSLTNWMRDYVFYSLALSKLAGKLGKWSRKKFNKSNMGKQIPAYIPTFVTFFCIGIWHGAGWGFIVFGLYNATIIVLSMMLSDAFNKINNTLRIKNELFIWRVWQIIRTFAIMAIGKCVTRAVSVSAGLHMLASCLNALEFDGIVERIYSMGMDLDNWFVLGLALILLFIVSVMQERGVVVRDKVAGLILPIRWIIYISGVLAIIILGVYGQGYEAASFIYRGF